MKRKLKIASAQMDVTPAPVAERLDRAANLITKAVQAGAQLIVFPELFNTGYEFHERNYALAESMDGETVTWMKAQAAQHNIHLAGTLLLHDQADIYNAGILVAPDGQTWRYDKRYVPLWERAYFRGGEQITVAETSLGKLGMMICWDHAHPDLWAQYAGQVDVLLLMSCPGDIGVSELIFPDGFRAPFRNLVQSPTDPMPEMESSPPPEDIGPIRQQAAWMSVPVIASSATGTIRTHLPLIETIFPASSLADRTAQASEMYLECGFPPATQVINAEGKIIEQGTVTGDGVIFAELEIPNSPSKPETAQPPINVSPEVYQFSDEIIPTMMVPLYETGIRRDTSKPV